MTLGTRQTGQLMNLGSLGFPPGAVNELQAQSGNCAGTAVHRGPLIMEEDFWARNGRIGQSAIALFNWEYDNDEGLPSAGGDWAWVWCKDTEDDAGKVPEHTHEFKVYLPVPKGMDPNVEADNVIFYYKSREGTPIAVGYGDQPVGHVSMDLNADQARQGWKLMDGSENAVLSGGSGKDMTTRFARCWSSSSDSGTTGGSATDTISDHTAAEVAGRIADHAAGTTGSAGAHDHGGTTGNTVVDSHTDHAHSLSTTSHDVDSAGGTPVDVVTGPAVCTSGAKDTACVGGTTLTHNTHNHTITNESAHTHTTPLLSHSAGSGTLSHDTIDTVPPFMYLRFQERINNSRNVLQKGTS